MCDHLPSISQNIQIRTIDAGYCGKSKDELVSWSTKDLQHIDTLVSRDGSRKRGGGNDTLSPVELKLSSSQKVTVMRECGSHRCLHLSDLGSPDIGRGKKNEAK